LANEMIFCGKLFCSWYSKVLSQPKKRVMKLLTESLHIIFILRRVCWGGSVCMCVCMCVCVCVFVCVWINTINDSQLEGADKFQWFLWVSTYRSNSILLCSSVLPWRNFLPF
jgi:hypothetical protein